MYLDTAGGNRGADWTLYDSGNNQISNANLNSDMELVLTDTDTYTLRIRGDNNNPVDYSFEIISPDTLEETLTIGETIEGEIGEKDEQDIYTFSGNQGQRLFLDTLINNPNNRATLRTPSGSAIINNVQMYADHWRHPIILPEDGTYELTVDGWGEPTDEYSFRLLDAASAPVLEMNTPTEGILNPGRSIQFYQFEGTEGERIYFQNTENSPNTNWHLYSSGNESLIELTETRLNTDFEYVLPGDGTYYLMLRGEQDVETNYNIQLVPSDEPATAFELNTWVDAEIEELGDRDVHTFSGEVGQTLYFDPRAGSTSITAQIHSPSGQLIFNGNTSNDSPPLTLTEPGTYKVSIDSSRDVTGDYSFMVSDSTTANLLGEATSGNVSKGETVLYQFSASAGQQLEFDSLAADAGADWVLYAPTTSQSNSLNIGSTNLKTDFTRTLLVNGDYILAVRNKTDSSVSYEFQVNDVTPTPDTNEGSINSELETLRTGNISVAGEVNTYEFSVETPTAIFFDGLQSDPNIMARLYAPDGSLIFNNARTGNDYGIVGPWWNRYYRAYQLTPTGDYKLEVYGYQQATGDYNFKLVDLAAALPLELDIITDAPLDSNETTVYKFDGQAGQKLWFDGLNTANPSITARLLNPDGDRIVDITNLQGDLQFPSLEADGEYYLLLQSNNSSDTTASFQLLDMSGASLLEGDANQEMTLNPWESLVYKFEGEAGEKVWIDGLDASHSGVKAWLYNSSGRKISENNYQWRSYTGLPNDIFLQTLEADGEYYLVLESKNNENTTTTFRLLDDDSATPLTFDTNVSGSFNPTGKEAFLYKFTGEEGQRLYFDTQNNHATEKIWQVYAPNGDTLQWEYLRNDLEQVLPASGEYLLALYTNNNAVGTVEDYEFRVVTPDPQENQITIGNTVEGQIEELGQQNTYTFTGTEGQRLWFDGLTGSAITAKLYSPANQELFSLAMPNDNGPLTLNETGTYRLLVDGNGASVSDYSFRFLDIDEDAVAVSLDEEISSTFGPSLRELHLYNFEADEGEYVFFDREKGTYSRWYYPNHYTVYGRDNEIILNQALSSDSETSLPYTGEYVLAFRPHVSNPGSEYSLQMVTPEFETTPLTFGETVSSTISEQGEWDTYTFTGTPGQIFYFDSLDSSTPTTMKAKLIAPSGKEVWSQSVKDDRVPFALDEAGGYKLIIDVDANNDLHDSNYSFRLLDFADATTKNLDSGEFQVDVGPSDRDTNFYNFTGVEGQHIFFDVLEGSNYSYALYDRYGKNIFAALNADKEVKLPYTGEYFLGLHSSVTSDDIYKLKAVLLPEEGITSITFGETISSDIAEPGERDFYSFEGLEGQILYFDSWENTSVNIDGKLIAPSGKEVWNQDVAKDYKPFVLSESGTYIFEVDGEENNDETGSYSFQFFNFAEVPELTLDTTIYGDFEIDKSETILHRFSGDKGDYFYFKSVVDHSSDDYILYNYDEEIFEKQLNSDNELELPETGEYVLALISNGDEPDNYELKIVTPELTTTPLNLGEIINSNISESGEKDFYSFEGAVGQKLFFDSVEGNSNIRVRLFSPTEIKVTDKHLGQNWQPFTLTENGTYRLEIDANDNKVGDYGFVLSDRSSTTPLELDTPTTGTLELGNGVDLYQFDGKQGQVLNFDLDAERWSGGNWVLYTPDNEVLSQPDWRQPDFKATLPSDGLYTLAISGTSSEPVSYGFEVTEETQTSVINEGLNVVHSGTITEGSQIEAIDPDADELRYQLIDSPDGAIVSTDTGEVVWFQESVLPGDTATFTVEVADGRGGTDSQTFTVEVEGALGTIQGAVFEDLNNNGYRDTTLVKGDNPDIVFVIDISGSTGGNYVNWETADIESVADEPMGILGMEMATAIALSEQLILQGRGDTAKIGVIPFNGSASILDMNPATPEIDIYTTPLADMDNNGVGDLRQVINRLGAGGGTNFTPALEVAKGWLESLPGDPNIIFLSDGIGSLDVEIVEQLNADNVNITAFGIGRGAGMGQLRKIDPDAIQVTDPREVIDIFSGWDDRYSTEPLMEGVTVYLDLNDNGELDEGEPTQITQKDEGESLLGTTPFYFAFDNLLPGEYNLRQVVPNGYSETAPSTGVWTDTITVEGETIGHLFGLHEIGDPPNTAPVFTSTAPTDSIEVGSTFQYTASATDGDADILSFDLTLKPEGMTVDGETGTLLWQPTEEQVGSFNVLLRVSDGKGGQDLQYLAVDVVPQNNAPVFTSTLPDNANAKVGQLFEYQAVAIDADGDALTYSLSDNAPSGISIDSSTGLLEWTAPQSLLDSTVEFEIEVTDSRGGIANQEINLKVNPAPVLPPLNLDTIPDTAATVNSLYSYQLPDNLSFNLATAPDGMTIDENGLLNWTPDETQLGIHDIVVELTDTDSNTVVQSWQLEVGNQGINRSPVIVTTTDPEFENQPPEIVSSPRISTRSGKTYFYQLEATDPDSDALNFELVNGPSGMEISQGGLLSWSPTVADFGYHDVSVAVGDGLWQTVQSWSLFVSDRSTNESPSITSVPNTITNTERLYQYQLEGFDGDGDLLLWSLDNAPSGMVIDPGTGMLSWQPTVEQIGSHTVAVRVTDTEGAYVGQEFDLRVTGLNTPPEIVSIPITSATPAGDYSYQVVATDPENDPLEFGLGIRPEGMRVDAETGLISWRTAAIGSFEVEVLVTDAQGATNRQSYTVEVGEGATNAAPSIVSSPVYIADVGSAYSYDVDATDPDGDDLSYQLIAGPDGMVLDAETGVVSWSNPILGTHNVVVGANDASLGAAQGFVLTVLENAAPMFDDASIPPGVAVPGKLYSYDVLATDPNGERLSYGLDDDSVALGMELDEFGRLRWTPGLADAGTHQVTITVTDGAGESVEQSFDVTVMADTVAPVVELRPLSGYFRSGEDYLAELGSEVTFVVSATDDVGVTGLQLTVDGEAVRVDGNGLATVPFESVGSAFVSALAVDAAGNEGTADFGFEVRDFSDETVPVAMLDDAISDDLITAPIDILGTVTDDGDVEYVLEVAPVAGGEFVEIGRGDTAVDGGALGVFDPSLLQNDTYVLRLTATDGGGNSSTDEVVVDVAGELKLGNFRLSFTDLSIPVSGIPISVTRTYDSLNASVRDDFGYGWRLEFRDMDLRTSVRERTAQEELLGVNSPFSQGERVYVTLPGGERTGFTFEPRGSHLNGFLGDPNAFMYHPEFVADDGSDLVLRVRDTSLVRKAGTNEFVQNGSGVAYNPADARFGGVYELVTKQGVVYEIDAVSVDLLTVTDRNGNRLTYSDGGIVSSTGVEVSFERDAAGRIVGVVDPEGNRIGYEYDENGDLVGVTDREENLTELKYHEDRAHYLEEIIDPLKRSVARAEYDEETGRLSKIFDVDGDPVQFEYDPTNSVQVVKDANNVPTIYEYDNRGNVVAQKNILGHETRFQYDGDNNITQMTDPNGNIATYTYDNQGNMLSRTEFHHPDNPNPAKTYYTYNRFGNNTSITLPTGATFRQDYDNYGNLLRLLDSSGNAIQSFTYDARGNVISDEDSSGTHYYKNFNAFGKPLSVWNEFEELATLTYNDLGQLETIVDESGTTVIKYDKSGREQRTDYSNGAYVEYGYEGAGSDWITFSGPTIGNLERKLTEDGLLEGWVLPEGETTFTYDEVGRLKTETNLSGDTTTYQYDEIGRINGYDAGGRLETVTRDGETLRLEYDENDQLIAVNDGNGNAVVEYVYDSEGRRVEVKDDVGDRDYVVGTTAGGLDSPFLIVKDSQVEAAFAYAGDSPLVRVDESGNEVYYLTDAMGSIIGLVDGDGQEIADLRYDSFGNLQTPGALPAELGGDFRFQGQWLESNTDFYHFRARYYDPQTRRFISRDLVEVIRQMPESSNPYQFVYNNPHIYIDPSGEIGFLNSEVIASKMRGILRKIHQNGPKFKQQVIVQAKDTVADIAQDFLGKLVPAEFAGIINVVQGGDLRNQAGRAFENAILGTALKPALVSAGFANWAWREVDILKSNGKPKSDGYRIDRSPSDRVKPSVKPHLTSDLDYVISSTEPMKLGTLPYAQKAWLSGDLKLNANTLHLALNTEGHKDKDQWKSNVEFVRNYQYAPVTLYFTLFTMPQQKIKNAEKAAFEKYSNERWHIYILELLGNNLRLAKNENSN